MAETLPSMKDKMEIKMLRSKCLIHNRISSNYFSPSPTSRSRNSFNLNCGNPS